MTFSVSSSPLSSRAAAVGMVRASVERACRQRATDNNVSFSPLTHARARAGSGPRTLASEPTLMISTTRSRSGLSRESFFSSFSAASWAAALTALYDCGGCPRARRKNPGQRGPLQRRARLRTHTHLLVALLELGEAGAQLAALHNRHLAAVQLLHRRARRPQQATLSSGQKWGQGCVVVGTYDRQLVDVGREAPPGEHADVVNALAEALCLFLTLWARKRRTRMECDAVVGPAVTKTPL